MKTPIVPTSKILTYTRKYFDFENVEENEYDIRDIAHGLSNVCRYAGQIPEFYSVAQHSVIVSTLVPSEACFPALMHDASEAFLGDVTTGLKKLLPGYKAIEDRVMDHIWELAGVSMTPELADIIRKADLQTLAWEKKTIWHNPDPWACLQGIEPHEYSLMSVITPMPPKEAEAMFLSRFYQLTHYQKIIHALNGVE